MEKFKTVLKELRVSCLLICQLLEQPKKLSSLFIFPCNVVDLAFFYFRTDQRHNVCLKNMLCPFSTSDAEQQLTAYNI